MRKRIGDIAIEVMQEENSDWIGYNEFGMLDEVWSRSFDAGIVKIPGSRGGMQRSHPINKQNIVLLALDRDERFHKFYIRCCDRSGRSERRVREFKLATPPNKRRNHENFEAT
jgi:hypothetical protein